MFCDLVGSTDLFSELDPEDVAIVLRTYFQRCGDLIEAASGFVAQYQGDGVLGYFGYTRASENSAEQAVRAALHIIAMVHDLRLPHGRQLRARAGISTGVAVVGDPAGWGTRLEQGAVGATLHIAARVQSLAQPNELVIANSTRKLTGELFVYRDLGNVQLRGFAEPERLWHVIGPRPTLSHFRARIAPLLAPIVDRNTEITTVLQLWRQVATGNGRILYIRGDAGIGKSRLIHEFRHRLSGERHFWLEGGGAQSFSNTPFHAIAELIKRALDPTGRATSVELRDRLERVLRTAGMLRAETFQSFAGILQLGIDPPSQSMNSLVEVSDALFEGLTEWLRRTTQHRSCVVVIEDLHWVDPSSISFIEYLIEQVRELPLLLICSMRPEFECSSKDVGTTTLALDPLTEDELRQVVHKVRRTAALLTDQDVTKIVHRAQGVPLFAIELARFVGEQHARVSEPEIPGTLKDLLTARLDQAGLPRRMAQMAAVIGDEAPLALLAAVGEVSARQLRQQLRDLVRGGVLRVRRYPVPTYTFTHSLLREAAYETLLLADRRDLHRRIGHVLTDKFPGLAEARPELLADHWTKGGELTRAVAEWKRAGDIAASSKAFGEAEQSYARAMDALMGLPPSADRDAEELILSSLLADALRINRGFSAIETVRATARARALADRNGDARQQLLQMWGEWTAASSAGKHLSALKLANSFYTLAVVEGDGHTLAYAYMVQMTSRYRVGDLTGAEEHFLRGEDLFLSPEFRHRPGVVAQTYGNAAMIAWIRGGDTEAQRRIDHALTVARDNDNPYDLAYAYSMAAIHFAVLGQYELAAELAQEAIEGSDSNFPQFAGIGRAALGRAKAQLGQAQEGIALIRDGLARMAMVSARVAITRYMTWLAEQLLLLGSLDDAMRTANEALQINPEEVFFRPETLRVRGEVYRESGAPNKAEQDFLEAIDLAHRMGARRFRDRSNASLRQLLDVLQQTAA